MRIPCWLAGHRRERETRFIRRGDGYPLAAYGACRNCGKRLDIAYGTGPMPAYRPEFAIELDFRA